MAKKRSRTPAILIIVGIVAVIAVVVFIFGFQQSFLTAELEFTKDITWSGVDFNVQSSGDFGTHNPPVEIDNANTQLTVNVEGNGVLSFLVKTQDIQPLEDSFLYPVGFIAQSNLDIRKDTFQELSFDYEISMNSVCPGNPDGPDNKPADNNHLRIYLGNEDTVLLLSDVNAPFGQTVKTGTFSLINNGGTLMVSDGETQQELEMPEGELELFINPAPTPVCDYGPGQPAMAQVSGALSNLAVTGAGVQQPADDGGQPSDDQDSDDGTQMQPPPGSSGGSGSQQDDGFSLRELSLIPLVVGIVFLLVMAVLFYLALRKR